MRRIPSTCRPTLPTPLHGLLNEREVGHDVELAVPVCCKDVDPHVDGVVLPGITPVGAAAAAEAPIAAGGEQLLQLRQHGLDRGTPRMHDVVRGHSDELVRDQVEQPARGVIYIGFRGLGHAAVVVQLWLRDSLGEESDYDEV